MLNSKLILFYFHFEPWFLGHKNSKLKLFKNVLRVCYGIFIRSQVLLIGFHTFCVILMYVYVYVYTYIYDFYYFYKVLFSAYLYLLTKLRNGLKCLRGDLCRQVKFYANQDARYTIDLTLDVVVRQARRSCKRGP